MSSWQSRAELVRGPTAPETDGLGNGKVHGRGDNGKWQPMGGCRSTIDLVKVRA